ncbi:MAG: cell division protein FtsQ/DivIB [Betaproteobacteria bacterium]|nr:cell division protein FtsQ/DivIB [Betaproteobacteria bacterium]MCC6248129.1 cell division protein FtsQ/DivIB [Rubrivivax sp.]MCL4698845.1 cell division protein FtsQ/DivIB [Burkholderiaceae bacterium]
MARLTRTRSAASAIAAAPARLPLDVRLMNIAFVLVITGLVAALVVAGVLWLTRAPTFTLRSIEVQGTLTRSQVPTLRTHALPELAGNFFSIDLAEAQRAFEAVPWVRRAIVRRIWPDRLVVQLEEHEALALWEASEGDQAGMTRLVNTFGEVFEANVGDVDDEALPLFTGPEGRAAEMLAVWQRLAPAFAAQGRRIERMALSGRGSWRAELDQRVVVEIGRGSEAEVAERTERFLRTVGHFTARYRQPLLHADLRHADGYAIRLRGVSTAAPAAGPGAVKSN